MKRASSSNRVLSHFRVSIDTGSNCSEQVYSNFHVHVPWYQVFRYDLTRIFSWYRFYYEHGWRLAPHRDRILFINFWLCHHKYSLVQKNLDPMRLMLMLLTRAVQPLFRAMPLLFQDRLPAKRENRWFYHLLCNV